jgi:hypothetical protein
VLLIVGIIGLVLVVLGGSCVTCLCLGARSSSTSSSVSTPPKQGKSPTPSPPTNEGWITAERPYVKFMPPAGWSRRITDDKEWGVFTSPTADATLAFTTFNRPGEATVRLGKAANVLGVSGIDWRTPRYGTVGRDKFNAHIGDGSCNFKGPNGYIWYATVDAGSSDQILLIFTVTGTAPQMRRNEAQGAIDTLQRR